MSEKKKSERNPLICPASAKKVEDLNFTERKNRNFPCGECGARLPLEKDSNEAVVPQHEIPESVRNYRRGLRQIGDLG